MPFQQTKWGKTTFYFFQELLGDRLVTSPLSDQEQWLPSPNQLRNRFILKNKKIRFETGIARGSLYRASTLDDSVEVDEEYDSDFGEEHFDDEIGGEFFYPSRLDLYDIVFFGSHL